VRAEPIGELAQDALDLFQLFALELSNAVAVLDRRWWLDEQRAAGAGGAVHDTSDLAHALAPHGDHVAPLAYRDGHVRRAVMRLETAHHALEDANELSMRRAQLAPDTPKSGRGFVAHETVLADRVLDRFFLGARDYHALDKGCEHGAEHGGASIVTQRLAGTTCGAQKDGAGEQLGGAPHDANDPQAGERLLQLGDRLGMPWQVAAEEAAHRTDTAMLSLEPGKIDRRRQRAHACSAGRRRGEARDQLEQPRILEDPERVRVHRPRLRGTKNPNGTMRPFGCRRSAKLIAPPCGASRLRSE
jgi:hypothetical protein